MLKSLYSLTKTIVIAAFLAFFCIRGFIFEPFRIPSASMVPNLLIGDFLFVSKFAYGNRLPLTDYFFWETEPERGDIAVFKNKNSNLPGSFFGLGTPMFIKRIVALPGDTVAYSGKKLIINGQPIPQIQQGAYNYEGSLTTTAFNEIFPNSTHTIIHEATRQGIELREMTVPAGMYVMLGDNRDNSRDSRFWNHPNWGFVKKEDLMGRAEFIFFSLAPGWQPRLNRFFQSLRKEEIIK